MMTIAMTIQIQVSMGLSRSLRSYSTRISQFVRLERDRRADSAAVPAGRDRALLCVRGTAQRSEEHTSELQSRGQLVCRLRLETKRKWCWLYTAKSSYKAKPVRITE